MIGLIWVCALGCFGWFVVIVVCVYFLSWLFGFCVDSLVGGFAGWLGLPWIWGLWLWDLVFLLGVLFLACSFV